jgi:hypothetical protein
MSSAYRRRGAHAAFGCTLLAVGALPARAQRPDVRPEADTDRWTVAAEYLHVGAAPIQRRAEPSMTVTLGRAFGAGHPSRALRVEAGWLRASRVSTQAQGVTLGTSVGIPVGRHDASDGRAGAAALTFRPGVAVLAGWAEAQTMSPTYSWRGVPNTEYAGQTGTAVAWRPVRGRTTGAGVTLAADLRLSPATALTGAVQQWAFTGPVIRPNRQATLAGVGLTVRPRTFVADTRRWWSAGTRPADAPRAAAPRPTVPPAPLRPTVPLALAGEGA